MQKFQAISLQKLDEFDKAYQNDNTARIVRNALSENPIRMISRRFEGKTENPNLFSIDIKTLPVSNQMASGRCWLFSSLTLLREMIAKKYKIKDQFELSQNYLAFYVTSENNIYILRFLYRKRDWLSILRTAVPPQKSP